jgi:hypothetical protein
MSEQDFLLAIAQLAIALIAFTNIVVALRQMGGGNLSEFQLHIVRLFSVCGFCTIFFALLPILLLYFGLPETSLWQVGNPPLALSILLIYAWYFRKRMRVAPGRPFNIANYVTLVILIAALVFLSLGTIRLYFDGSIAPYAFTLVGLLVASALAFLNTLTDFLAPQS